MKSPSKHDEYAEWQKFTEKADHEWVKFVKSEKKRLEKK